MPYYLRTDQLLVQEERLEKKMQNQRKCKTSAFWQKSQNADGTNPFVAVVEMCGGVDKIEDLQRHENHKIYDMAVRILETYFGVDDDEK